MGGSKRADRVDDLGWDPSAKLQDPNAVLKILTFLIARTDIEINKRHLLSYAHAIRNVRNPLSLDLESATVCGKYPGVDAPPPHGSQKLHGRAD